MKVATKDIVNTVTQTEMDAGKLSARFDVEVSDGSKVKLPAAFDSEVREDLVKLAVASSRANRRQAYGSRAHVGKRRPMAGMKHSVEWWGKGRGVSRIMRRTGSRRGAQNPHTLGGRRAHGPKSRRTGLASSTPSNAMLLATLHLLQPPQWKLWPLVVIALTTTWNTSPSSLETTPRSLTVNPPTTISRLSTSSATRKAAAIFAGLGLGPDMDRARNGRKDPSR